MFPSDPVYSGQEVEGFLIFPTLHVDVSSIDVVIHDAALRFDARDEPVETVDLSYGFGREVRKESGRTSDL
jgi:hypothetical protein